jgi:pantetheine-phosphate adenylyltransferase
MLRVVVGGTFEYMHRGHMALLKKAFDVGDFVYIGLTSDRYVKEKKGRKISSYLSRLERLRKEVRMLAGKTEHRYRIAKLEDRYGPALRGRFDAIIVSSETEKVAREINRIRRQEGIRELRIIKIRRVLAYDGKPISSYRIFRKEIDAEGRKLL